MCQFCSQPRDQEDLARVLLACLEHNLQSTHDRFGMAGPQSVLDDGFLDILQDQGQLLLIMAGTGDECLTLGQVIFVFIFICIPQYFS